MLQLEGGRRNQFSIRRAASILLPEKLITPGFTESNVSNLSELAEALRELATSAGLLRQHRWSVALPEATTRTLILTVESQVGSKSELEDVLKWKIERGFGATSDDLSVTRQRLPNDSQGRERYIAVALRTAVLAEYESVFNALGWRAGLMLPRHMGEACWLTNNGAAGDSLLLSSHEDGFTAVVYRDKQPLILRSITCEPDEREDELYRILLFYRDRRTSEDDSTALSRLLVVGEGFDKSRVNEIASETLGGGLRVMDPAAVGLRLPASDISFDAIAGPAGLASLHWA